MLRIDLSALSQTELRRLLTNAEDRGQTALAVQLQGELTARRAGGGGPRPPPAAFDDDDTEPMVLQDHLPALSLAGREAGAPPARRRPIGALAVGLLLAGVATAWGLTGAPGLYRRLSEPPVRPAMASAAPPSPVPAQRAMVARVEPATPADVEPAPPPRAASPARVASTATDEPSGPRRLDPCARPPTPADRTLCNDLGLNLLDHEMREAYGRAMTAGADPVRLRADQTAWRAERDPTSDPRTLARLYDRRIGELKGLALDGAPDETP